MYIAVDRNFTIMSYMHNTFLGWIKDFLVILADQQKKGQSVPAQEPTSDKKKTI